MLACFFDLPALANHRNTLFFQWFFQVFDMWPSCHRSAPRWCLQAQSLPQDASPGPPGGPQRGPTWPKMGPSTDATGSWQPCWPLHGSPDLQEYRQDHNQTSKQPCWHAFLTFLPRQIIEQPLLFNCFLKLLACGLLATCEL